MGKRAWGRASLWLCIMAGSELRSGGCGGFGCGHGHGGRRERACVGVAGGKRGESL